MKNKINCRSVQFLGDELTPISLYKRLREHYSTLFLLEASDYHGKEKSTSIIAFDSLYSFSVQDNQISYDYGNEKQFEDVNRDIVPLVNQFMDKIEITGNDTELEHNGLYGYTGFDAISYFDTVELNAEACDTIPEMEYHFCRFILIINPFDQQFTLIENLPEGEKSKLNLVQEILYTEAGELGSFNRKGEESTPLTDEEYMSMVTRGKEHCHRGDVFQIVLSRRFTQKFEGDDLNLYRALRSINPSPYLFYFNFGDFKIIGSSPEAEIIVKDNEAQIHPIAGTYRRSGDDATDKKRAEDLSNDPKEVAEHIMLVDLARNDLSRNCTDVSVERFKEVQYFSHVIHLVSNVIGKLKNESESIQIYTDTFPAGTLSGAPKYRAIQLIDSYEPHRRGFYGGAIGYFGFNGSVNHAIIIRSFLSINDTLHYQAGAGVVISSKEESERDEVNNKLAALKVAIEKAEEL